MPTIELILLLLFIGSATGATFSVIHLSPALIAIPAVYFFLPVFDLSFQNLMLPIMATCITAFMPTHLYAWIQAMRRNKVDSQNLINFAPGIAMGGVIGAQLLSLVSVLVFKIAFTVMALIALANMVLQRQQVKKTIVFIEKPFIEKIGRLPTGLFIGTLSVLSGNGGGVLTRSLCMLKKIDTNYQQGTSDGLVVFASIAAMVGFMFPAKSIDSINVSGFAGAVHLPSMLILACSHWFFYRLCLNRGNSLDKKVLWVSLVVFMACSLVRLWIE